MSGSAEGAKDIRARLHAVVEHLEHLLPGQAPIRDFVHHNTLHGFQHLQFSEALAVSRSLTGARGYLSDQEFREIYRSGRIDEGDLVAVLDSDEELGAAEIVAASEQLQLQRRQLYLVALLHPLHSVTASQLNWQLEEMDAAAAFQADVAPVSRACLLASARAEGSVGEAEAIAELWSASLEGLGLSHYLLHPEELVDLSAEQAEKMLAELSGEEPGQAHHAMERQVRKEAENLLGQLLERVGGDLTLGGLMQAVTGHDLVEEMRPTLLRQLAAYLDQGVAAWHGRSADEGFYAVWRRTASEDLSWIFEEISDWRSHLESLPEEPMEAILTELHRLGLRQEKWPGYLERLALELPGWSGMFLWRHRHQQVRGCAEPRIEMIDYLAVRLVLEHMYSQRLSARLWQLEATLDMIRWHFRHHSAEFLVRYVLYNGRLPEYLASKALRLAGHSARNAPDDSSWWRLASMVSIWRQSAAADRPVGHSVYRSAWRLFRLAQHLGVSGGKLRSLSPGQLDQILATIDRFSEERRGYIWLQAYERHYRERLLAALQQNFGRAPGRVEGASAQLVFCMDDREEGMRRHLEEVDASIETYGAAAHFNVPHIWHDIDGRIARLTPVVVDPVHEIRECVRGDGKAQAQRHREALRRSRQLAELLHLGIRRNLISSSVLIALAAPAALLALLLKTLAPRHGERLTRWLKRHFDCSVPSELKLDAVDDGRVPTTSDPRKGFTEDEQLDRIEALLRNIGLVDRFAPLVVIMAHGSVSQNNPHLAAYDCGACSGRHSGPNARIAAAIANRPRIRQRLARERGIEIPLECWFLGAEHNTCSEAIEWYDLHLLPAQKSGELAQLRRALDEACRRHAQERCRRFASASAELSPAQSLAHVRGRAVDFSQARPELGHATNAAALVGRRSMSRGAFFDRRVFLISYDHNTDPGGEVLERLLLANAPVGAGISLEYYFSTVDNERYGSGSKVTHNITGMFGVMDGTASDLRTGLPRQMIEIHEAMRLQLVIEARPQLVAEIYTRQPELRELIGNGWLLLSVVDPGSGEIKLFDPGQGFIRWEGGGAPLPRAACSSDCYRNRSDPVEPALLAPRLGATHAL
ncbi:MAG: DUF2309 domain-containing protein [Gammaproteobacteria bacterium]|nr:DUF2309 domain-containing protein [Gammaproteobacteria bacterium]